MLPNKRRLEGLEYSAGNTREVRLAKGFLEEGLMLSGTYTSTVTTDATAVRAYAMPIQQIQLVADGGKVLHSVRPADLVIEQLIYEQAAVADMLTPPDTFTIVGGPYSCAFQLLLPFREPFAREGRITNLPSWIYDELLLRVQWGDHAQVFVGGVGSTVMDTLSVVQAGIQDDFSALGDPFVWGRKLLRSLRSYREVASAAVADQQFTVELPRTADYRSIVIVTEDSDGEPVGTIVNSVTLEIDNTLRQYSLVPQATMRQDNGKIFGVSMPAGVQVLEFAEDEDIIPPNILEATKMTSLNLILDKAAIAGTIRVFMKRIEVPAR